MVSINCCAYSSTASTSSSHASASLRRVIKLANIFDSARVAASEAPVIAAIYLSTLSADKPAALACAIRASVLPSIAFCIGSSAWNTTCWSLFNASSLSWFSSKAADSD